VTAQPLQEIAERRSQVYWFLSRLFIDRPDTGFVADLDRALGDREDAGGSDALRSAMGRMRAALTRLGAGAADVLGVEYTRLLRGVYAKGPLPPPFESLHLNATDSHEATVRVANDMMVAGFADAAPETGPQDHIGAELRFLALLCYRESEAWSAGDLDAAEATIGREVAFLDEHVMRWVPGYCERLAAESREPFYRAVADVVAIALREDRARTGELLLECSGIRQGEAMRTPEREATGD
jgi:TorA maturation chaperone TorD